MNRWISGLAAAVFLAAGFQGAQAKGPLPEALPSYVNVRDFGAAGDAAYHHPLGVRGGEEGKSHYTGWYWAGHFSQLATAEFQEPFQGSREEGLKRGYLVVPNTEERTDRQIPLSQVNPAPFYEPAVGDVVLSYEAADAERSVYAADDSAAFEAAIGAGDGALYLPEGDYLVSQLTAAKITGLAGPGRIWLKEWEGGVLWYLLLGLSDLVEYQGYGWIDAAHFHDGAWRSMHWVGSLPQVNGWTSSAAFTGHLYSSRIEYPFDESRENVNVWLTVTPAVPEEAFPESVTLCISKDMAAFYSLEGQTGWIPATEGGIEGAMYHSSWNGRSRDLPEGSWKDCGEWIEVLIPKESFFSPLEGEPSRTWLFHCWSARDKNLRGLPVEFTMGFAKVWVKEAELENVLTCAIGGDMRSSYWDRPSQEYYIHEAYYSVTRYLTSQPQAFYAYNVDDGRFDAYFTGNLPAVPEKGPEGWGDSDV